MTLQPLIRSIWRQAAAGLLAAGLVVAGLGPPGVALAGGPDPLAAPPPPAQQGRDSDAGDARRLVDAGSTATPGSQVDPGGSQDPAESDDPGTSADPSDPSDPSDPEDGEVVFDGPFVTPTPEGDVRDVVGRPAVTPPSTSALGATVAGADQDRGMRAVLLVLTALSAAALVLARRRPGRRRP